MNKKLTIHKRVLNYTSFDKILELKPRVLILMCHGQLVTDKTGKEHCYFCFEDEKEPWLIDKVDEERLSLLLKDRKTEIDCILLSTCHSERLGKMFVNILEPAPAVVCINSTDQIAQASTFVFNPKFLQSLLRGNSVQEAFD